MKTNKTTRTTITAIAARYKTNLFALLPGGQVFVDRTGTPWQLTQMFLPVRGKVDFLFGAN